MKARYFVFLVIAIVAVACNKDKFTTVPQVSVKSISPTSVNSGNVITLKSEYTDDEGDIDSILVVYKWYNGATVVRKDTFRFSAPDLGVPEKTRQADINVVYEYNTNNTGGAFLPGVTKDTTATLGLVVKDKKANRSEYSESEKIRLKKP